MTPNKYVALVGLSVMLTGCPDGAYQNCIENGGENCILSFSIKTKNGKQCYQPNYDTTYVAFTNTIVFRGSDNPGITVEIDESSLLFDTPNCLGRFRMPNACVVKERDPSDTRKEHRVYLYEGNTDIPSCSDVRSPAMIKRAEDLRPDG